MDANKRNALTIEQTLSRLPQRSTFANNLAIRTIDVGALKNEFRAAKRGQSSVLPIRPHSEFAHSMLDRVTLGTKPTPVDQNNGEGLPATVVTVSRAPQREPVNPDCRGAVEVFQPPRFTPPLGKKYCTCCGDWVSRKGFSKDDRQRDKLKSWCKTCCATKERERYWARKGVFLV